MFSIETLIMPQTYNLFAGNHINPIACFLFCHELVLLLPSYPIKEIAKRDLQEDCFAFFKEKPFLR
jgi:hypothetical protein